MEEFTRVSIKKSRRKRIQQVYDETSTLYFEKLLSQTSAVLEQFDDDPQLLASLSSLRSALDVLGGKTNIREIICYGLGSLSNCKSSVYQLSLIIKIGAHFDSNLFFYDPVFSPADVKVLESLKCSLIEDDKGLRKVGGPTLFFLPHAPRFVMDNILSSNWGPNLCNCIMFGDNILTIVDNSLSRVLKENHPFLFESSTFVDVFEVQNKFKFNDVFNDFAVHVFAPSRLAAVDPATWNSLPTTRSFRNDESGCE